MKKAHVFLYVTDRDAATRFCPGTLGHPSRLHVPGMTEVTLAAGTLTDRGFARDADG